MGWPERLDAMERRLDEARQLVRSPGPAVVARGADPSPTTGEPPAGGGSAPRGATRITDGLVETGEALPAELAGRALSVLEATRTLEGEVRQAMQQRQQAISRIGGVARSAGSGTKGAAPSAGPAYVDFRA